MAKRKSIPKPSQPDAALIRQGAKLCQHIDAGYAPYLKMLDARTPLDRKLDKIRAAHPPAGSNKQWNLTQEAYKQFERTPTGKRWRVHCDQWNAAMAHAYKVSDAIMRRQPQTIEGI